jgi:hypothetical protein
MTVFTMHKLKKGASVGLVFPLYGMTLPVPVEAFLSWNNWFSWEWHL